MPFQKGHKKIEGSGFKKGEKSKKTKLKESVGLDSWEKLQKFMLTNGLEKFIDEVSKMKGQQYAVNFLQMIEYFKPKLARTESNVNFKGEIKNFIIELTNEADSQTDTCV
jgi:hypothetical protein